MATIKFGTYHNRSSWHKDEGTVFVMDSLTDESFRHLVEIDEVMLSMKVAPSVPPKFDENNYETASWTFEDWQNQKAMLERKFLHLTPEMRAYFVTPQAFLEYCTNPDNYQLLEDGMQKKPDPQPIEPGITIQPGTTVVPGTPPGGDNK